MKTVDKNTISTYWQVIDDYVILDNPTQEGMRQHAIRIGDTIQKNRIPLYTVSCIWDEKNNSVVIGNTMEVGYIEKD